MFAHRAPVVVSHRKMMAGFVAAMTTQTGKIGYLGPLINEETRRLATSCYLGARYAWEKVLNKKPADLKFKVTWIGFWFNIPGVTADPTQVAQSFFDTGHDVIISGIDTTEAVVVARQKRQAGKPVWAVPYDYIGACEGGDDICLGVPYFNWGPGYLDMIKSALGGKWDGSGWVFQRFCFSVFACGPVNSDESWFAKPQSCPLMAFYIQSWWRFLLNAACQPRLLFE